MGFYCQQPSEGFRRPSVHEAEAANQTAMEEVFDLCFAGQNLDGALNHVTVDRDALRHLLTCREAEGHCQTTEEASHTSGEPWLLCRLCSLHPNIIFPSSGLRASHGWSARAGLRA